MNTFTFNPAVPKTPDTQALKERFILAMAGCGDPVDAAAEIGSTINVFHRLRKEDKEFAKAWDETLREAASAILEATAFRRAVSGSDALLMFLMKAYNKDIFNEKLAAAQTDEKGATFTIVDATAKKPK